VSIFLDPDETLEHEIEGETFLIRVLPSRRRLRLFKLMKGVRDVLPEGAVERVREAKAAGENAEIPDELAEELGDHYFDRLSGFGPVIQLGCAGWRGPSGAVATEVELDANDELTGRTLDRIPIRIWAELFAAILSANTLSADTAKN